MPDDSSTAYFARYAPTLQRLNVASFPVKIESREPAIKEYNKRFNGTQINQWARKFQQPYSLAIPGWDIQGIDVDSYDLKFVQAVLAWIERRCGRRVIYRVGQAPRILIPFRWKASGHRAKRASAKFRHPAKSEPKGHRVEVLGDDNYWVAYGWHPVAQKTYEFPVGDIEDAGGSQGLPQFDDSDIDELLDFVDDWFEVSGYERYEERIGQHQRELNGVDVLDVDISSEIVPQNEYQIARVVEALKHISYITDGPRDQWRDLAFALQQWSNGKKDESNLGWVLFRDFSKLTINHEFSLAECEKVFFHERQTGTKRTIRSIFKWAQEKGWDLHPTKDSISKGDDLAGPDGPKDGLRAKVEEFNRTHAWISQDPPLIVELPKGNKAERLITFKYSSALQEYATTKWMVEAPDRNNPKKRVIHNVLKVWQSEVYGPKQSYYGFDMDPSGKNTEPGTLNLWTGLRVKPRHGDIAPFLHLMDHLFPVTDEREYLLNSIAKKVQNPGWVPGIITVLMTEIEGSGKSRFVRYLSSMFAPHYTVITNMNQLTNQHNDQIVKSCIVHLEEFDLRRNSVAIDTLKSYLTSKHLLMDIKFGPKSTVKNIGMWFMCTNHTHVFNTNEFERRLFMPSLSMALKGLDDWWGKMDAWIDSGHGPAIMMEYFLNRDVSKFNHLARPRGYAYQRQRQLTTEKNPLVRWAATMLRDSMVPTVSGRNTVLLDEQSQEIRVADLRESYVALCRSYGIRVAEMENPRNGQFGKFLKESLGWTKRESNGSTVWQIPPISEARQKFKQLAGIDTSDEGDDDL